MPTLSIGDRARDLAGLAILLAALSEQGSGEEESVRSTVLPSGSTRRLMAISPLFLQFNFAFLASVCFNYVLSFAAWVPDLFSTHSYASQRIAR